MNVTEFGNVSSLNWTINATLGRNKTDYVHDIHSESVVIHAIIAVLTLLFNGYMIVCLQKNRSKVSEVIYKQLFSLCISDFLAGISCAAFCLTLKDDVNRSSKACALIMASFPGAQNAVLLNLSILSFRRWAILRKAGVIMVRSEPRLLWIIMLTLCPWIVSLIFASVPMFIGMTENPRINGCLSPDLIEDFTGMLAVSALQIVALLVINVFYIYSVIMLKRMTRQAAGVNQNSQSVHQRAYLHLFAVLIITNITTLPSILLMVFVSPDTSKVTVMNLIPHFQSLNSLLNPLLYAAQISEIRAAIKGNLFFCWRRRSDECN